MLHKRFFTAVFCRPPLCLTSIVQPRSVVGKTRQDNSGLAPARGRWRLAFLSRQEAAQVLRDSSPPMHALLLQLPLLSYSIRGTPASTRGDDQNRLASYACCAAVLSHRIPGDLGSDATTFSVKYNHVHAMIRCAVPGKTKTLRSYAARCLLRREAPTETTIFMYLAAAASSHDEAFGAYLQVR